MKFRGHGIDTIDEKKYVTSALDNGGGVFRIPLPEGELGKELEAQLSAHQALIIDVDRHGHITSIIRPVSPSRHLFLLHHFYSQIPITTTIYWEPI